MPNDLKTVVSGDYCIGRYAVVRLNDSVVFTDYSDAHAAAKQMSKHDVNEHYVVAQVRNQCVSLAEVHAVHKE